MSEFFDNLRLTRSTSASTRSALDVSVVNSSGEVVDNFGGAGISSTNVTISSGVMQTQQITSSGADVTDATNASIRVTVVEEPAGGSTQVAISSGIVQVQHISDSGASLSTDATPASTRQGLVVRQVDYTAPSTTVAISSVSGLVKLPSTQTLNMRSSAANALVSVYQSTASELNVTVAGYVAPSTIATISTGSVQANLITSSGDRLTTNATPGSTAVGLITRQVDYSTTMQVSSVGGLVKLPSTQTLNMRSSAANALVSVYQSTASELNVTVDGYVAPSTIVTISTGNMSVHQVTSSGADISDSTQASIRVTVVEEPAGGSTQVAISSGVVQVQHITSSGGSLTTNTVPASTSYALMVREVGGGVSTQVAISSGVVQVQHITSSGGQMTTNTAPGSTAYALITRQVDYTAPSTIMTISTGNMSVHQVTSSGADISDSTNASIRVTVVEEPAGGSTQVAISSGIVQVQHITSSGAQMTTNTTPGTTSYALITRQVDYSTTMQVSSVGGLVKLPSTQTINARSSAANMLATIYQSTASELNVTVAGYVAPSTQVVISTGDVMAQLITSSGDLLTTNAVPGSTAYGVVTRQVGYSTTMQVSSLGGAVHTRSTAAEMLVSVYQSTASELNVTVAGYSTTVNVSSGTMHLNSVNPGLISSGDPVIGSSAMVVELNPINSTYISGEASSAESTIAAAVSTSAFCVFALNVSVAKPTSQTVRFLAASTNEKWRMFFHSSAISMGAVEAVTPPNYLFKTAANQSLAITSSGGTANVHYSLSYFEEG